MTNRTAPVSTPTDGFSPRERAALIWTERVTLLAQGVPSDEAYAELRAHFSEAECVNLLAVLIAIQGWNRLAVSFGLSPLLEANVGESAA